MTDPYFNPFDLEPEERDENFLDPEAVDYEQLDAVIEAWLESTSDLNDSLEEQDDD